MEGTMLELIEKVIREINTLQKDTNNLVLNGTVTDMERYRFLMGRLEGLRLAEQVLKDRLKNHVENQ
jgi:hypothetical protein|tara:strand:- start:323 stop:523 length:201 start_codon:yes stop_codon:yes gene_type:complete